MTLVGPVLDPAGHLPDDLGRGDLVDLADGQEAGVLRPVATRLPTPQGVLVQARLLGRLAHGQRPASPCIAQHAAKHDEFVGVEARHHGPAWVIV